MIYPTAQSWRDAPQKQVLIFAMSGLGKTYLSNMLRSEGNWFHYSVDYRIGTRYMGEYIVDNFKKHAMRDPFLAELLRTDSIFIGSNISFDNLSPLSTYLGKPGNPAQGGIAIDEYRRRQAQHHRAETDAMLDTPYFIRRAQDIYGYQNFICDCSGSLCEVVTPDDPNDPVLQTLSQNLLMVWIKGTEEHTQELIRRFDKAPKPMCYQPEFLDQAWKGYQQETNTPPDQINPDDFIRWTYARAMAHRQPRYATMAKWGVTLEAADVAQVQTPADFENLIATAIEQREAEQYETEQREIKGHKNAD